MALFKKIANRPDQSLFGACSGACSGAIFELVWVLVWVLEGVT